MKSRIFHTSEHERIASELKDALNVQPDFVSGTSLSSTRAVGDAVQAVAGKLLLDILGNTANRYSGDHTRRAMADIEFYDTDGLHYVVDVKTHRRGTAFSMPNLVSVKRLTRLYESDTSFFCVLYLRYSVTQTSVVVEEAYFVPIEFLAWKCLRIGMLGWGQIQIAKGSRILIENNGSRRQWMLKLCELMLTFYPSEIAKIAMRVTYFEKARRTWEDTADE